MRRILFIRLDGLIEFSFSLDISALKCVLKADISDLQFRNSLCALIDILGLFWVYCAVFNTFQSFSF